MKKKSILKTYIELLEKAAKKNLQISYLSSGQYAIRKNRDGSYAADIEGVLVAAYTDNSLEDLHENGYDFPNYGCCYTSFFSYALIQVIGQKNIKKMIPENTEDHDCFFTCKKGLTKLTHLIQHYAEHEELQPQEIADKLKQLL